MPLPVVQPCPLGFCTPAGGGYFLTGGLSQPFSPWVSPAFLNFARRLGGYFLTGGHFQPLSPWGSAPPSNFARRLEGATSSPAGILNPFPRGARPLLRILHAGWGVLPHRRAFSTPLLVVQPCPLGFCTPAGGLLPHRRTFSTPLLVVQPSPLGFCTPAGGVYFLTGGHSQLLSPWFSPALAGFARRLGRSASSPAGILSPSPRGVALPS